MVATTQYEEVAGVIKRANERGLVLEGRDDWFNISRYAEQEILIPPRGTRVVVTVDESGFLYDVRRENGGPAPERRSAPNTPTTRREPQGGALPNAVADTAAEAELGTYIARQTALTAAVQTLSSGGRATDVAAVIAAADVFLTWVRGGSVTRGMVAETLGRNGAGAAPAPAPAVSDAPVAGGVSAEALAVTDAPGFWQFVRGTLGLDVPQAYDLLGVDKAGPYALQDYVKARNVSYAEAAASVELLLRVQQADAEEA